MTFLKSTLWSFSIYFASLFTIPGSVACRLQKIMRDFLWSNNELPWVNWGEVYRLKRGGLGIRPLHDMNDALKTRWIGFADLLNKRMCFGERW